MGGRGGYSYSIYKSWKEMKQEVWSQSPWAYKTFKEFAEEQEKSAERADKKEQVETLYNWTAQTGYVQTIRHAQTGKPISDTALSESGLRTREEALRHADILEDIIERSKDGKAIVYGDRGSVAYVENQQIYRGLKVPDNVFDKLKPGEVIDMGGLSSWSTDRKLAESFAKYSHTSVDGKRTVFYVKNGAGLDINDVSHYDQEYEVLVSGKTRFEVISVEPDNFGVYTVTVRQIEG